MALSGLIDTLAQLLAWRFLLWLSITWWRRYLTQSNFLSSTSLAWSLALHLFCSVRRSLYGGRKYTHTRARAHTHTHTHTHTPTNTHTHTHVSSILTFKSQNWWRIFTLHFYPTCPRFLSKLDMASETLSLTELNLYKTSR